jgi:hypothetical protein
MYFMPTNNSELEFDKDILDLSLVKKFNDFIEQNTSEKYIISCTQKIKEINIAVFAYLVLISNKNSINSITLDIKSADEVKIRIENTIIYILTSLQKDNISNITVKLNSVDVKAKGKLSSSDTLTPLMYIKEHTIKDIFNDLEESQTNEANEFYKACYERLENTQNFPQYEEKILPVIEKIKQTSKIKLYIFNMLANKANTTLLNKANTTNYANNVDSIWNYTLDLNKGLYELAKNIITHSSTQTGFITIRLLKDKKGDNILLNSIEQCFNDSGTIKFALNINVIDLGDVGIIKTLSNKTIKRAEYFTELAKQQPDKTQEYNNVSKALLKDIISLGDKRLKCLILMDNYQNYRLNQQIRKDMVHMGLATTAKLITKNDGFFHISSKSNTNEPDTEYLNIKENTKDILNDLVVNTNQGTHINMFIPIIKNKEYKSYKSWSYQSHGTSQKSVDEVTKVITDNSIEKVHSIEITEDNITNNKIVDLNIHTIDESKSIINLSIKCNRVDPSNLLRTIAEIKLSGDKSIMLTNIKKSNFDELIDINDTYQLMNPDLPLWSENDDVIICYILDNNLFYTSVLWGANEQCCYTINKIISSYTSHTNNPYQEDTNSECDDIVNLNNDLFINNILKPLDMFISSNKENNTIFEHNVLTILATEFDPTEDIKNYNYGYKLANTHFAIGSKIHIEDFYYAKGMLQDGFFALRFALWVFKQIKEKIYQHNKILLVGYGIYSELLLSFLAKIIRTIKNADVRYITTTDDNKIELQQNDNSSSVFIIVPIASTFSTTIKIQKFLQDTTHELLIKEPHINIIYASDTKNGQLSDNLTKVEKANNIVEKNIKNKVVKVKPIFIKDQDTNIEQKYFIALKTKWHNSTDCEICHAETDRKALLFTDKSSVAPNFLLTYPKGRAIDSDAQQRLKDVKDNLTDDLITYGYHEVNGKDFMYSIDSIKFIDKFNAKIIAWLKELKNKIITNSDKTLIISPAHTTNSSFIQLVSDYVFDSSVHIIHYDYNSESRDNFYLTYQHYINDMNTIVFVDDSIKSGETFRVFADYISYFDAKEGSKKIDYCIFLFNKSQEFLTKIINATINKNIYAFFEAHLYTEQEHKEYSSIKYEQDRYEKCKNLSVFDAVKEKFNQEINNIENPRQHQDQAKRLIAKHYLIEEFTNKNYDIDRIIKDNTLDKHESYKVLTHPPFNSYKPVIEQIFKLVESGLNEIISSTDSNLERIKFYIRRCSLVGSNIIISQNVILYIGEYSKKLADSGNTLVSSNAIASDFVISYIKEVKELLTKNPVFAIYLAKQLKEISSENRDKYKKIYNLLYVENNIILYNYINYIKSQDIWSKDNDLELEIFEQKDNEVLLLQNFFTTEDANDNTETFLNTLNLLKYLDKDDKSYSTTGGNNTNCDGGITNLVKKSLDISQRLSQIVNDAKCFMIVKDVASNPVIIFNDNNTSYQELGSSECVLKNILNQENTRSYIKYNKSDNGWRKKGNEGNDVITNCISNDCTELLLIRINKFADNEIQGILGFYGDDEIPIEKIKYLLLLKNDISKFIKNHHENNEFAALRELHFRRRMEGLTGHGSYSLYQLSNNASEQTRSLFSEVVATQAVIEKHIATIGNLENEFNGVENIVKSDEKSIKDVLAELKNIAQAIIESEYVEMDVSNQYNNLEEIECSANFKIRHYKLLYLICYELIVNAKKNRYHLKVLSQLDQQYANKKNDLKIYIEQNTQNNQTYLWIENTTPATIIPASKKETSGVQLNKKLAESFLEAGVNEQVLDYFLNSDNNNPCTMRARINITSLIPNEANNNNN